MHIETTEMQYAPPPKKPKQWMFRLRCDESFRQQLEEVVRLWRILAEARGDDADQIDLSFVARRLLTNGIDAAFADFGGRPDSEESWASFEREINKKMKATRR